MPRFSLNTNVPVLQIPDDFLKTSTALMSKTLGKNIAVSVVYESKYYIVCNLSW